MDFEPFHSKVKQLLISKAKNNLEREAIIEIKELDFSIKVTDDMTDLFQDWLNKCPIVKKTAYMGKGRIKCIVKKEFIEENF